jgi:hypothetical protein
MRRLALPTVLAALLAAAPAAAAEGQLHPSGAGSGVEAYGILGWGDGAGFGIGYHTPIVPQGLLRDAGGTLRDTLDLECGVDWLGYWGYHVGPYDYGWAAFDLHAGLRWNLWLTPQFAVYPQAGLGFGVGWYTGSWDPAYGSRRSIGGLYPDLALGAVYRVRRDLTLRAELGAVGLKLGLGFEF